MEFEYKVTKIEGASSLHSPLKLQEILNNYGKEGWQLVNILYPQDKGQGWIPKSDSYLLIFNRQIIKDKMDYEISG